MVLRVTPTHLKLIHKPNISNWFKRYSSWKQIFFPWVLETLVLNSNKTRWHLCTWITESQSCQMVPVVRKSKLRLQAAWNECGQRDRKNHVHHLRLHHTLLAVKRPHERWVQYFAILIMSGGEMGREILAKLSYIMTIWIWENYCTNKKMFVYLEVL